MVLPAMAAPASCSRAASSERRSLDSIPSHVPTAARGTIERRPDPAGSLPGGARRQGLVRRAQFLQDRRHQEREGHKEGDQYEDR